MSTSIEKTPTNHSDAVVTSENFDLKKQEHIAMKAQGGGPQDDSQHTSRIVAIAVVACQSSNEVLEWSLKNFIRKETDLVVLIHVRKESVTSGVKGLAAAYIADGSVDDVHRKDSHSLLKSYGNRLEKEGYHVKAVSVAGDPGYKLCEQLVKIGADELIIGASGMSKLKRAIFGSVTQYCVEHAKCGVLVVKTRHQHGHNCP
ncbi:Universal stress protein A-like protein [Zancudomyces culisetae]|uniref:Universal stress protein A-like protein n=1 Tax=Zancudomyces culisetae TaxID=1213189 RepID=A0A1R1PQR6_ZANCU|nr:Universal stress protein A-like protein [Zancudomyces culisetae]|eukprot:OMH83326.1 Universal stress protein A-like protein [Zancudomyces culisetae]